MEDEKVVIKNVRVEYIATKTDKFNNEICYFKLKDKNIDTKFSVLINVGYNKPWFKTDKGHYILKVKTKYTKLKELKKEETILTDIAFKYYKMGESEGFYVSLFGLKSGTFRSLCL